MMTTPPARPAHGPTLSRRSLCKVMGGTGAGLTLGLVLPGRRASAQSADGGEFGGDLRPQRLRPNRTR